LSFANAPFSLTLIWQFIILLNFKFSRKKLLGYSPDEPLTIIEALMVHQNGL